MEKIKESNNLRPSKNTQQHVKKYDNVTVILGDSMVKD